MSWACSHSHAALLALVGLAVGACAQDAETPTQVVVAVNASMQLTSALKALRFDLYPLGASDPLQPARRVVVALGAGEGGGAAKRLPLSVGLSKKEDDELLLVVHGCDDGPECRSSIIEQAMRVRFEAQQTVQVDVVLADACLGAATRCSALQQTCAPLTSATADAGECVAVPSAASRRVVPGEERFPTVPEPGASRACPPTNTCLADAYPCQRDEGEGYVCLGQMADWPMPDSAGTQSNVPRYDTSVAGVVRDELTGLRWQRITPSSYTGCTGNETGQPGGTCNFEEALDYCSQLELDGRGWRLPSKIELESLFDYRANVATLDPGVFFTVDTTQFYWTLSPVTQVPGRRWTVWLGKGLDHSAEERGYNSVRCVRSPATPRAAVPARYVNREGRIGDARTGLLWDADILCGENLSYTQAEDFCASSPGGMRLPTQKELLTMVDPTRVKPAVDPVFAMTPERGLLWSSTIAKPGLGGPSVQRHVLELSQGASLTDYLAREGSAAALKENPELRLQFCVRCVQ